MLLVSQRLDSPRMEPTLPGSLKRKLAGTEGSLGSVNRFSDSPMTQGSAKRLCLEDVTLPAGTSYPQPPFPSGPGLGGQGGINSNNNGLGSPYSMPPKASPASTPGNGGSAGGGMGPPFNPNGGSATQSVEQELQDILDELTNNPNSCVAELDIEKIIGGKGDEGTTSSPGSFMHPEGSGTPKRSPQRQSHLEAHLTRSPGFPQAGSPQVGPSPGGTPYTLPHPSKPVCSPMSASPLSSSSSQSQNQARSPMLSAALSNRAGSSWHEVSRAQQLQQLASNSNKHHSSSSQGPVPPPPPPPSQSGLSSLGQPSSSTPSWAGPSPPYRPGDKLSSSSPHQQPFSPATSSIQSPQSSLISSLPTAPAPGPSPPYRPEKLASPALAQPPFSPQNSLLPSGSVPSTGGSIQGSPANYLPSVVPATSGTTGPSTPYRQENKHCSPSVTSQQNGTVSASMASSQLYKAITSSQPAPSSLKALMQHSQAPGQMQPQSTQQQMAQVPMSKANSQESFSFSNTKPLCHFDPEPPTQQHKIGPLAPAGQVSMGGPFRGPGMQATPPTSSPGHPNLLRLQRGMQPGGDSTTGPGGGGMVPHCREDPEMVARLHDPSCMPRPPQGNSYNSMLLKNQLMRKHLEKQRQMEQMNGAQMPDCQQVAPFQGGGRPLPPECSYQMGGPQTTPAMLSHGPMPAGRIGLPPGPISQVGQYTNRLTGAPSSKQQPFYHPQQDFGMLMRPGQGMMGMGGLPRQPTSHPGHGAARMPGPAMAGGSVPTQHLRQALNQGGTLPPRIIFKPQQTQSQVWQHQQGPMTPMDPGNHQHSFANMGAAPGCGGPPQYPAQQSLRMGMPAGFGPHQTANARPTPPQMTPGMAGRQLQKLPAGQPMPPMAQQNLRLDGPLSAMAVMKPGGPSMMHHPSHGMAPPSYPSSSSSNKQNPLQGYGPGPNPGHKMPPYDFLPQYQSNGGMSVGTRGPGGGPAGEVDFIDTLVGSNEDWLNSFNIIDCLEQNSSCEAKM
ncbi:mastermind-like protein 2 [Denticeps clupeoides]|uniref:Mastermind-like domain-containing protein 1 n=1 Tax=Denticeps clupeoides TaxID=299321 RepID=A0AAY4B892_9TELE|nr:mastermind-like domain-containing protein 1 [Denticeps clupeoides]